MEWVLLFLVLALLALVGYLIAQYNKAGAFPGGATGGGGGGGGGSTGGGGAAPSGASTNSIVALQALQTLLQRFVDEDRRPTEAECTELNNLYDQAVAEGAPAGMLTVFRETIDRLCGSN